MSEPSSSSPNFGQIELVYTSSAQFLASLYFYLRVKYQGQGVKFTQQQKTKIIDLSLKPVLPEVGLPRDVPVILRVFVYAK